MIWWVPDIPLGPVTDPTFMLSTGSEIPLPPHRDPKKVRISGTGPWTELYPVKLLRPGRHAEALLLLLYLYFGHLGGCDSLCVEMEGNSFGRYGDAAYNAIAQELNDPFKDVWIERNGMPLASKPACYNLNHSLLRLRKRLLANDLPQTKNRPPLPDIDFNQCVNVPEDQED